MNNEDDRNNGDGSKLTTSRAANGLQAIAPEGAQESHSDLRQAGQPPRQAFAHRLSPIQLRRPSRNERFEFGTTAELPYVRDIIGQPRGVRAIEFGIKIDGAGYNIFMLGPSGSGRTTAVRRFLERQAREGETPHDWAYVYNFKTPHKPRALMLPTGKGALFRDAMEGIVTDLRRQIPHVLDAEEFRQGVEELDGDLVRKRGRIMEELLLSAAEKQLSIVRASAGLAVVPISNGQPVSPENFAQLPEAQRQLIEENSQMLQRQLDAAVIAENKAERETAQAKHTLEADAVAGLLDTLLTDVKAICADNHKALRWLDDFRQDILDGLDSFKTPTVGDKSAATELSALPSWLRQAVPADTWFRRYRINLIVDHSANAGAPVVLEDLPTFKNLVGYIESEIHTGGASSTDFTMIKPGALHMANGGYLIIQAKAILKQSYAWEALKRALRSSVIRIEDPELRDGVGVLFPQTPAPEPIPLSIKVIMLGTAERYYTLQSADDEFAELFKVKADFSDTMARNDETELQYAHFVAARCHEGHLPHFDATGVTSIIQFGSWLAEDQTRLSTRFGEISNLIHEAAHWTLIAGNEVVSDVDVQRAIEERTYRNNLVEEEIQRSVLEGRLFIDTAGEIVGQVNALSVLRYGDYYFGQPNRVTARAFLGNEGVINIEREVEMAGPLHNKGLLTLTGYLGGQYALEHPLSLTASLAFEQNYGGIDGDSASTAELFALLSALSGYPLRQELAVTGSVNQLGKVQPIGAATQKIEGFYKICKERGLTGSQGVIIPASNVMGLMLSNELVSAVEKGQFHVYAVETIDQGIEILTGMAAGERDSGGSFPAGTVHHAVQARLQDMAMKAQRFSV